MNKKVIIFCCGFVITCVTVVVYAACSPPVANFSGPSSVYCGDQATFTSSSYDPDGCSIGEGWSASGGASPSTGAGKYFTTKWCSTGEKSVTLTVTDDDRPCCCGTGPGCSDKTNSRTRSVNVLPVNIVSVNSADAVCRYGYITFTVTTSPPGKYECISWSGGDSPTSGSGGSYTTRWDTAGMKTVTATGCNNSMQKQVAVVEVDYISSNDTVCVGSDITFTAITNPKGHGDLVTWSAPGGSPDTGAGTTFTTRWYTASGYGVTAACGNAYEYKTVYVMEVSNLEVYPNDYYGWCTIYGGSTITVLKSAKYTFKGVPYPSGTWPAGEPHWSGIVSGTGQTIDVSFTNSGTYTLTAKCGSYDSGKTITIKVMEPTVYQFGFGGDHELDKTPSQWGGWADGTTPFTDPVYDSDANKSDPVCVTKDSNSISLTNLILKISEALTYPYSTSMIIDASGTEDWNEVSNVTFSGLTSAPATLGITGNIINQVNKYSGNFQINWKYKVPSGTNTWYPISTTSHTVYVTWGTPSGSSVTEKRIEFVCNAANGIGGTNPNIPANAVFNNLSGSFDLSGPMWGPSPIWLLHDPNESSQCPGLADYVNKHFQMLGLGGGAIRYCHANPDGTYAAASSPVDTQWRTIVPGTGHPDPTTHDDDYIYERLAHVDGNGNANAYEATCLFTGYHYALGVGIFTNAKDVVKTAFTSVEWQYRVGTSTPYTFLTCMEDPWVEAP